MRRTALTLALSAALAAAPALCAQALAQEAGRATEPGPEMPAPADPTRPSDPGVPPVPGVPPLPPAPAPAATASAGALAATGVGEVERAPDFARVFVSVTNRADAVADAVSANREATAAALARIEELGVPRDDVLTANFQVFETPEEFDRDGRPRPRPAFTASHQIEVMLRDIARVGEFAGEILALDAMTFQSVEWGLERSRDAEEEALSLAVEDARRQAEVLARAAGVGLGPIRRIGDAGLSGAPAMEMDRMAMRMAGNSVPIVPPARLTFTARVAVEWALSQP